MNPIANSRNTLSTIGSYVVFAIALSFVLISTSLQAGFWKANGCQSTFVEKELAVSSLLSQVEIPEFLLSTQGRHLSQISKDRESFYRHSLARLIRKMNESMLDWDKVERKSRFSIDPNFAKRFANGSAFIHDFILSLQSRGESKFLSDATVRTRIRDWLAKEATAAEQSELRLAFEPHLKKALEKLKNQKHSKMNIEAAFVEWCFEQVSLSSATHLFHSHPRSVAVVATSQQRYDFLASFIRVSLPKPADVVRKQLLRPSLIARILNRTARRDNSLLTLPSFIQLATTAISGDEQNRWTESEIRQILDERYYRVMRQTVAEWIDAKKQQNKVVTKSEVRISQSDSSAELAVTPIKIEKTKSRPSQSSNDREPAVVAELRSAVANRDLTDLLRQPYFSQAALDPALMKRILSEGAIEAIPELKGFFRINSHSSWKALVDVRSPQTNGLISLILLSELPLSPLYYRQLYVDLSQSTDQLVKKYSLLVTDVEFRRSLLKRLIVSSNVKGEYTDVLNDPEQMADMTQHHEELAMESQATAESFEETKDEVAKHKEMVSLAHSFQHELDRGRLPFDITHLEGVGYDIFSVDLATGSTRHIEVKHRLKDRFRLYLTYRELRKGVRLERTGDALYLYLVEVDPENLRSPRLRTFRGITEAHIAGYDERARRSFVTLDSIASAEFED